MIKFINSHQQALEDHSNVYKNASASETMQNAKMYNAYMYNATTKPRKQRDAKQRPTKLTKTKVGDQKG